MGQADIVKDPHLVANSPHNAFYNLTLERITDGYLVRKESGGNGIVLHREAWYRETLSEAEKLFARILRQKTNPNSKRKRKYVSLIKVEAPRRIHDTHQSQAC